jgi:DNA transformation protein
MRTLECVGCAIVQDCGMNPNAREFVNHCVELLTPLGLVRARRMFGGHGVYVDDVFIAIIAVDRLYLKVDAASRLRFEAASCEPFVYDAKGQSISLGYLSAPQDAMDSPALMLPWARLALEAALRARAGKRGSTESAANSQAQANLPLAKTRPTRSRHAKR